MGQTISYPPFDVVVYLTKFLWFDDIHSLTAVNHTLHLMLEGESDLWPWLLTSALQRVVSLPFPLVLGRVGVPETKALIRRTCDHPTAVDAHILRKYKGPQNVVLEAPAAPRGRRSGSLAVTVRFEPKTPDDSHSFPPAQVPVTKRSVVSNNCFPCLAASARVPNALLPFAKVMAVTPHCMSGTSNHRNAAPFLHTATLSCIAYFEGTISLPTKSPESDIIHQSTVYSIGIAAAPFPVSSKLPGEDHYSFGYVSKSGHVISRSNRTCSGSGLPYGEGDTVGCGLIYPLVEGTPGHMIFTKNGEIQHKVPILANDMKTFFSIAWFPVMGVATAGYSSISMNFGIESSFMFDIYAFELDWTREMNLHQGRTLSDAYMYYINSVGPTREQKLNTKYLSRNHYSKKDTFSLFAQNILLHQTLLIMEPQKYKNQGAILSDDSSSDEDSES